MGLKAAGHDLAGARGSLVDENDRGDTVLGDRRLAGLGPAVGPRFESLLCLSRDDDALADEQVAHVDGRGEEPARVVAKIEDQTVRLAALVDLAPGLLQIVVGVLVERRQANVGDAGVRIDEPVPHRVPVLVEPFLPPPLDGPDLDHVADDRDIDEALDALASDAERHFRPLGTGDAVHRIVEAPPHGGSPVDLGDAVVGLDARVVGGRPLQGAHDHDLPFLVVPDEDAHAREAAVRGLTEPVELVGPDHLREGIQLVHRAVAELAEKDLAGKVDRLAGLVVDRVEQPGALAVVELIVGGDVDPLELILEEVQPGVQLLGIPQVRIRLRDGGRGRENAKALQPSHEQGAPATALDVLRGGLLEDAPDHLVVHALQPLLPVLGERRIELVDQLVAEALGLPVAKLVQPPGRVVGQQGQPPIDAIELVFVLARVLVEDVEPVEELVGKKPVPLPPGHGNQSLGPGDDLGYRGVLEGRLEIIAEGLHLHGRGQGLGDLVGLLMLDHPLPGVGPAVGAIEDRLLEVALVLVKGDLHPPGVGVVGRLGKLVEVGPQRLPITLTRGLPDQIRPFLKRERVLERAGGGRDCGPDGQEDEQRAAGESKPSHPHDSMVC